MTSKRIGRLLRPYLEKARDSALLAIEVYNKPAIKFRSSGYIALMVIAWTALLHAVFIRQGVKPYYKNAKGKFQELDGDFRHWELAKCVEEYWKAEPNHPVRSNVEFFIPLRNKIEHRHLPELDTAIFGECQALLLNFDDLLGEHFGAAQQLRESLSFSLQLFPSGDSFAQAVKANKKLSDVKKFIDGYRAMISTQVIGSSQFAFKAFLIQVTNHQSGDALPIQFFHRDKLTDAQKQEFDKFAVMVKTKEGSVVNGGLLKPSVVVTLVQAGLGNPKVTRPTGETNKFNVTTHSLFWKRYKVRPVSGAKKPAETVKEYCVYDEPHKDYLYTGAWVKFLIEKMKIDGEYEGLFHPQITTGSTTK
ncbi:DUF3644 domain-containing protein [Herbaspirillum sp. NPDC101397]|uniref:DUF3644 domain-containing protein n=1 Tax=Herbaspirillum sp. NPDC101397 TaxID=3364006 RepID=UPI00383A4191